MENTITVTMEGGMEWDAFTSLSAMEMMDIDGGKWGWVGLVQPIYDFGCGVIDGFKSCF